MKAAHTSFAIRGKKFCGNYAAGAGRPQLTVQDPVVQILIKSMEKGCGGIQMQFLINNYRAQHDLQPVGLTCIYDTVIHLNVKFMSLNIQRRKQGSDNPDSPGAKASLGFTMQLLIQFGEYKNIEFPTPLFYNKELLPYQFIK